MNNGIVLKSEIDHADIVLYSKKSF